MAVVEPSEPAPEAAAPPRFAGVLVALVTPLRNSGELDEAALDRLAEHVLRGGVTGICAVGSSGEGPRLGRVLRCRVVSALSARIGDAVPLIASPYGLSIAEVLDELEEFARAGVAAGLVSPPSYYPLQDDELVTFYRTVADASPIPILLYNIPAFTGAAIPAAVLKALAAHPRVHGLKDSSRNLEYFTAARLATEGAADFSLLTGTDTLLAASLSLGGDGAIAASANLVPELGCALYAAARGGSPAEAATLQRRLFRVVTTCRRGTFPAGWKAALEAQGLCSRALAPPAQTLTNEQSAALALELRALAVSPDSAQHVPA